MSEMIMVVLVVKVATLQVMMVVHDTVHGRLNVVFSVMLLVLLNSNYVSITLCILVVNIAFQQNTQDVPETQSVVVIPIVLTGNRAVPITFA